MSAPMPAEPSLAEIIAEWERLEDAYDKAFNDEDPSVISDAWEAKASFWDEHGPRLAAVARAGMKVSREAWFHHGNCPGCNLCVALDEFRDAAASGEAPPAGRGSRPQQSRGRRLMGDKTRGLFGKFLIRRSDGSDVPGGKHDGCRYFVLDLTHDPHAIPAALAYAASCRADGYGLLADDLERMAAPASGSRREEGE